MVSLILVLSGISGDIRLMTQTAVCGIAAHMSIEVPKTLKAGHIEPMALANRRGVMARR